MKKTCLILGGGSDIGSAIVKELASSHVVHWTSFNTKPRADQPGIHRMCDLRDVEQVRRVFEELPQMDVLVTAAFPFLESDNLDFAGYLAVEPFLRAHVLAITLAAEKMKGGKIFNILGQCVERGLPGGAFYSGAFAFLHNYANSINGKEGKARKVSICDLLLGPVDTREWSGLSPDVVLRYKAKVAQFISPQQVAETVRFLESQEVLPSTFKLDAYYGY
jgi:NAD(P)-dependent dehydrogenase (short-subunit alcohol dehydrogenase family)